MNPETGNRETPQLAEATVPARPKDREQEIARAIEILRASYEAPRTTCMLEQSLRRLWDAFDGFENLRGKRILDIGCGGRNSFESRMNDNTSDYGIFHPWSCRAAVEFGAFVTGIDRSADRGEKFTFHGIDLLKKDSLAFLPDHSFDGIQVSHLLSSPDLVMIQKASRETRAALGEYLKKECTRLLAPAGKIIEFDNQLDDY